MSVAAAATELDLTPARVRALIAAGALPAEKVGSVYVLHERDVDALARRNRPRHVRAMSPRIAWAAAALADGIRPAWVRTDELSRLRGRLSRSDKRAGAWRAQTARVAGERHTFRAGAEQVAQLLAHPATLRTGRSATNLVTDPLVGAAGAQVWARTPDAVEDLRRSLGLLRSSTGNVTVSVPAVHDAPALGTDGENVYRLIVASDLLAEADPRSATAATALLEALTREARWMTAT